MNWRYMTLSSIASVVSVAIQMRVLFQNVRGVEVENFPLSRMLGESREMFFHTSWYLFVITMVVVFCNLITFRNKTSIVDDYPK